MSDTPNLRVAVIGGGPGGYAAALDALGSYDFVEPGEIFVFAHSLGPLLASLALPGKDVRGVIAAETIGRSWFEYTQENVRRQSALVGEPLDPIGPFGLVGRAMAAAVIGEGRCAVRDQR